MVEHISPLRMMVEYSAVVSHHVHEISGLVKVWKSERLNEIARLRIAKVIDVPAVIVIVRESGC